MVPYLWFHTRMWCDWPVKKGTSPCFWTRLWYHIRGSTHGCGVTGTKKKEHLRVSEHRYGTNPWFNTRMWCHWRVKKGTSPCFWARLWQHIRVSKHGCGVTGASKKEHLRVSIQGYLSRSMYWNTQIQKYLRNLWKSEIESPSIETWQLWHLHVFKHGYFSISMYWNTEIKKSPCFYSQR